MASRGAPPDFSGVVGANHLRMRGWIWAQSQPCLSIAKDEVKRVRRNLAAFSGSERPPKSPPSGWWILAVLLCPGDSTEALSEWARDLKRPLVDRVRFYLHPETDPVDAFVAWYAAGFEDPKTAEVGDFATFHKQFGWDFNNQVYRDATSQG